MKTRWAAVGLLVLAGCASPHVQASTHHKAALKTFAVVGQITTPRGTVTQSGDCTSEDGYEDVAAGGQVTVTDAAGKVVGVGHLQSGVAVNPMGCSFYFEVDHVPAGSAFYGVEVTHRGKVRYAASEVRKPVNLDLGQ